MPPASAFRPPVPEHSVTGLGPLIPLPDWVRLFRYRTGSGMGISVHSGTGLTGCRTVRQSGIKKRGTAYVYSASVGGGERNTHAVHVQTAGNEKLIICKCQNVGMREKSRSGIGISSGSQLSQSGIGIPASGFNPVPLLTD
jgi:hypothetical protein